MGKPTLAAMTRRRDRQASGAVIHAMPRSSGFADLVSHVLCARRCSLMLTDGEGNLVVEESVGLPPYFAGTARSALGSGVASRVARDGVPLLINGRAERESLPAPYGLYESSSFIIYPIALPQGTVGVVNVTEREGNAPFEKADLDTLAQLVSFYVSTFDSLARQEILRLRREVRRLRAREIRSLEKERQRLARDLHDDAGHALTAAILRIDMATTRGKRDEEVAETLGAIRQTLTDCAEHLHDMAFYLQPRLLTDLGLAPAIRSLARRAREASNIEVEVQILGEERRLDTETELAAFRIAQESMTNALKYARATRVDLELSFVDDGIGIRVRDDGTGFDPAAREPKRQDRDRHGLHGMRERAEMVGGMLDILSAPGRGTTIQARLPEQKGVQE
ncbi:MAG TPA: GAF domain-containing sensor histidine kinase [Thermomicrobiales bacterium]|nr:GAF domain-containing sensor histidine kinase [Thermomicrobiales bacterium]